MKNPSFLHSEVISNKAIEEVLKFYKNNKNRIKDGQSGPALVQREVKESKDLSLSADEFYDDLPLYSSDLVKVTNTYKFKYPELEQATYRWGIVEPVNIQRYKPGQGFYKRHYERENHSFTRLLVFMTYLSDSNGTYFKYQDHYQEGKKGLTLIWPADWTFTHSGVIDFNDTKTIITGWFNWIPDVT